ncbi:MAG: bifunctional 3-(3-hydroxy-phenyl)propionate/3-hydroxycinnamic acid hydroxylase [Alphaproteobacteria bacterium]|nr:bifunctional 3-(3-hydroxy-phenyl)propionate/3-hydroxycinnamic acid hydroxylase [Alphaproteobacteria bacterium]
MRTLQTDVLIAGYGPTGETLAAFLGIYGIRAVAIDTAREVYRQPRAAHFDHEIMRVWQRLGIAEQVLPSTRALPAYEFRNSDGQVLMRFAQAGVATPSGWAPSYMFHQPAVEEALRARVAQFPGIDVRLGTSLVSLERNDANGVAAIVRDDQGLETRVEARFLVGADGGGSTVRRLIDGQLTDYGFDEPWLVIDTVVTDEEGLPPFGLQMCDPKRPTTVMPMAPLRRRWEFMLLPGETPEQMLDDARIEELLKPWVRPGQAELVRKAVYRFHGLVAKQWRVGSVVLAGDAAHQMPPFMGQGMCSGIRDADALAWRLASAVRGEASPALLDSYQEEREPHVRSIIETAIFMGRVVCTLDPAAASKRDQDMLAQRAGQRQAADPPPPPLEALNSGCMMPGARAGQLFPQAMQACASNGVCGRLDDLLGPGFWLITRNAKIDTKWPMPVKTVVLDEDISDESGRLNEWLDSTGASAVLVRPDRYVFGTGEPAALAAALTQAIGR